MEDLNVMAQPDMIDQVISVLKKLDVKVYTIIENKLETVELYFIKKNLDMRRINNVTDITLMIYRDFEKDGKKMRGSATTSLYITMSIEEIEKAIATAYYAASFVNNPYYDIPEGSAKDCISLESKLLHHSTSEVALQFAEALYAPDNQEDIFINSSEFFSKRSHVRIINSQGIDVSYVHASISGEFVVTCTVPQDVETYRDFNYNDLDLDSLTQLSKETLELTKFRAQANTTPTTGHYDIILSNNQVETILSYYVERSSSGLIYPGYSNYKIGSQIQDESVQGERLNISLKASVPYSTEGIPLSDRPLITDGTLDAIQGDSRFAYYLGIPAIGYYPCITVDNGAMSLDEMKQNRYLEIVNFSDFQMDSLSGDFGGEIRLAFYYDGNTVIPVTGGSISGNISNYHKQLYFSKERQIRASFEGPKSILLKDVSVSGS